MTIDRLGPTLPEDVLVAIPTQGRRDLRRLGHSMQHLPDGWSAVLFVNGSTHDQHKVDQLSSDTGLPAVQLPATGYASARNGALNWGSDYRWILFFDDDQIPCQGWGHAFQRAMSDLQAQAVIGPRVAVGSPHAFVSAQWTRGSKDLSKFDSGFPGEGYTGNTLLDMAFVRSVGLTFDPRFDLDGGEDTDFFRRFRGLGGRVTFEPHALAIETVDDDRLTMAGVFRAGQVSARRNQLRDSAARMMLRRFVGRSLLLLPAFITAALTVDRLKLSQCVHSAGMVTQYAHDLAVSSLTALRGPAHERNASPLASDERR